MRKNNEKDTLQADLERVRKLLSLSDEDFEEWLNRFLDRSGLRLKK